MATVKNIDVAVRANTQSFEKGMRSSSDELDTFAKKVPFIDNLATKFNSLGPVGAGVAASFATVTAALGAATAAAASLWLAMKPVLESVDAAAKAASRLGIETASLQGLQFGGGLAGVSPETLTTGLERMSRSISDAAVGNVKLQSSFRQLGMDLSQLQKLKPDEAFLAIGDAISGVENPMDRLRLTMEIFGRSGAPLVNFLQQGSAAMREQQLEAVKLRLTNSELDAITFQQLNDNLERLTSAFVGLANVVTQILAPALTSIFEDLTQAIVEPEKAIKRLAQGAADLKTPASAWEVAADTVAGAFGGKLFADATKASDQYFASVNRRAAELANQLNTPTLPGTMSPAEIEEAAAATEAAAKAIEDRQQKFEDLKQRRAEAQLAREMQAAAAERGARVEDFRQRIAAEKAARETAAKEAAATLKKEFDLTISELDRLESLRLDGLSRVEPPAALERFSQEAFSAFQRNARVPAQDKLLEETKRQTAKLDALVKRGVVLTAAKGL